ncbi:unnamed protein product [Ixodes persulcatus]
MKDSLRRCGGVSNILVTRWMPAHGRNLRVRFYLTTASRKKLYWDTLEVLLPAPLTGRFQPLSVRPGSSSRSASSQSRRQTRTSSSGFTSGYCRSRCGWATGGFLCHGQPTATYVARMRRFHMCLWSAPTPISSGTR